MNLKENTLSLMHLMKENMMIIMKDKRTVKYLTIKKNQIETKKEDSEIQSIIQRLCFKLINY